MQSPLWNKIAMALGFSVLGLFAINEYGNSLFYKPHLEQTAYHVDVAAEDHHGAGGQDAAETILPDFGTVLANADIGSGERSGKKCLQCHTFEKGGVNKAGPNLWGVIGRPTASVDGMRYSSAMSSLDTSWDFEMLDQFLKSPNKYLKGTSMKFPGLRKEEERINVIAYLRTLSDTPVALPAPRIAVEQQGALDHATDDTINDTVPDTHDAVAPTSSDEADGGH